jgi:hypothetical protein
MDMLNNEAEGENTLFSLAVLRSVSNQDLIRAFLEARAESRLEQQNS